MLRRIGAHAVGPDVPVFVIAEIGLNHGGSLPRALALVEAAAWAGASAIKLQTLFADRLVAPACPAPAHVEATSLREFFAQFELSLDAHRTVAAHARARGLAVMTTPFAEDVLPALEEIELDAYKIASGDLTYDGLIAAAAATTRPLIVSTGMGTLPEIGHALQVAKEAGSCETAVLHCVSAYPAPPEAQNLKAIETLVDAFGLPTGLSDHGSGLASAVVAVTLGACIYERHLVLDGDDDAIDRAVSSTPAELRAIVTAMAHARLAIGSGVKVCQPAEAVNVTASRRGLYATRALQAGERVTESDVIVLRPANALAPSQSGDLVGSILQRDIAAGEPFSPEDLRDYGYPTPAGSVTRRIA
ncbi:MAG: N-acetylneuraminate synthase family protein [Vicinamibacterales bacterium]